MRCLALLLAVALSAAGEVPPVEPKAKASEYPIHAKFADFEFGAEYMVRSVGADQLFVVDDYLVVLVALYPLHKRTVNIDSRFFTLRINGKKDAIFAQAPGMVAASLKYPDWRRRPQVIGGIGAGDGGIILGRPQSVERFPGDPRPRQDRLPNPPGTDAGIQRPENEAVDPAELVQKVALPDGPIRVPTAGYLYFAYTGKLSKVKNVDLVVQPEAGEAVVLRLR
jgi:hypothetical protein